jgi:hypothetical protein
MHLKLSTFLWWIKKQNKADGNKKADKSCDNGEQCDKKKGQSSFKKFIRCLEDTEEPVAINANVQNLIKPVSVDTGCIREDSRIRDWLLDSARFATPPATPHGDPSQKDSAASEAAFSKATTASHPQYPEDKQEPHPVLAKLIRQAPQPTKREQEHEVLFSRRATPSPAKAAGPRPRPDRAPASVGDAAALGEAERRGAAATTEVTPAKPNAAGEGWERRWWSESLGLLMSSPVTCTQARRSPASTYPCESANSE